MAAGVEARVPLLDESMLKLALAFPQAVSWVICRAGSFARCVAYAPAQGNSRRTKVRFTTFMVTGSKKTMGSQLNKMTSTGFRTDLGSMRLKLDQD